MTILTNTQRAAVASCACAIYDIVHDIESWQDQFPKDYYDRLQAILKSLDRACEGLENLEIEPSPKNRKAAR